MRCLSKFQRFQTFLSKKLDIVLTQFFVHRHVRGKWACKSCQALMQELVEPHIIEKGMPAEGLLAHVLVNRFIDHRSYCRQEQINARSGVHTPRSTLAGWLGWVGSGRAGAALMPFMRLTARLCLALLSCTPMRRE